MEWVLKLEARTPLGETETIEITSFKRQIGVLSAEELGLSLAEGKQVLENLQRIVLQTQVEEYIVAREEPLTR